MTMLLRAFFLGLSAAALVTAQSSVLEFTRVPNPVTDGQANVLLWSTNDTTTPSTISLLKEEGAKLTTVEVLTKAATGGQYIWHPASSIADGTNYKLLIKQGTQNNTYGPFVIQGANPSAVAAASSSATSSTSTNTKNSTTTAGTHSMGTSTTMHRNTTMSAPTLTKHTSVKTTTAASTTQKTPVSSSSSAAQATDISSSSSSLALVLGAMAAIFYLH